MPEWLTLDSDGTISGTPTAAWASTFTVTATNASGSDSKEFTLTISEPAPIYTISADVDPVGAGTVSGGGKYTAGTYVTLTATPNSGYRFVGWLESGTTVSTNTNYTFVANSDRSLTAQFDRISSGGGDSDPTYSITLPSRVTGGELKLSRRYAEKGETVTLTAIPDEGYELDTLTVTDSKGKEIELTHKGGNEYTFKMPAGRVEIEVSFREIEVELPFTDVPEGAWYADAAAYVYKHGLMAGTSATTFAPGATTSRSMIATILWRMAGSPVVNYAMDYTDVAQGQWYSEAIRGAACLGPTTPSPVSSLPSCCIASPRSRTMTCPSVRTPISCLIRMWRISVSMPSPPCSGPWALESSTAPATAPPSAPRARLPVLRWRSS